jgi:hypothetical protein
VCTAVALSHLCDGGESSIGGLVGGGDKHSTRSPMGGAQMQVRNERDDDGRKHESRGTNDGGWLRTSERDRRVSGRMEQTSHAAGDR